MPALDERSRRSLPRRCGPAASSTPGSGRGTSRRPGPWHASRWPPAAGPARSSVGTSGLTTKRKASMAQRLCRIAWTSGRRATQRTESTRRNRTARPAALRISQTCLAERRHVQQAQEERARAGASGTIGRQIAGRCGASRSPCPAISSRSGDPGRPAPGTPRRRARPGIASGTGRSACRRPAG